MTALLMDRATARRRTRTMAGVGAVLLAGSIGVAALSVFSSGPRASAETILAAAREQAEPPPPIPGEAAPVDLAAAGSNLARIANKPVRPEPPPVDPGVAPVTPEPPAADALAQVRFLGVIREPRGLVALVSVAGRQRVLRAGSAFKIDPASDAVFRIVDVTPDDLVVNDGAGDRRLARAPRTGPAVTYVGGAVPPASPIPGMSGAGRYPGAYPGSEGVPGMPQGLTRIMDPESGARIFDDDGRMIPVPAQVAAERARRAAAAAAAAASGDSSPAIPQAQPVFDDIKEKNEARPQ